MKAHFTYPTQQQATWLILCALAFTQISALSAETAKSLPLKKLLPRSGYESMALQKKHPLGGMTTPKSEIARYPFNLGPTGILAERDTKTMSYQVIHVAAKSPADGKIHPGDVIVGANHRTFDQFDAPEASKARFPNVQMGMAIEESEQSKQAILHLILKRESGIQNVAIQLQPLGAYGPQFPKHSDKADYLIALNADILAARQLEDGTWSPGFIGEKKRGRPLTTCISALALMATGNDKYRTNINQAYEAMLKVEVNGFRSWRYGYLAVFLGEHYLKYQDRRALKVLKKMCHEVVNEGFYYNGIYGYGHNLNTGNYRYGGINACTAHACMAVAMAKICGIKVPHNMDLALARTIEHLSPDGAMGYAWTARSKGPIENIKHNEHSGRTGMAAMAYRLMGGRPAHYQKMLEFLLTNSEYADCGHSSGGSLSWIWGSLAMGFDNEKKYLHHMRRRIWYFNFNRQWDGGFYIQPSAHLQFRPSDTILGPNFIMASNIMLFSWNRQQLLCTNKPSLLPQKKTYQRPAVASSDFYERQDRVVEIAETISQLGKHCPPSVKSLLESLKKLPIEDPHYENRLASIYKNHLKSAAIDVTKCRASESIKSSALASMLGINHSLSVNAKAGKTMITISHRMTPVNLGTLKITSTATGSDLAKSQTFSSSVNYALRRDTAKLNQRIRLKKAKELSKVTLAIQFEWDNITFGKKIDLHLPSEEIRGKWSRMPYETVYGPFDGEVEMSTPNGGFRVILPGNIRFECALMKNCLVNTGQQSLQFGQYLKKFKPIAAGTKVRFSYFNRGSKIFLPMCNKIEILE